MSNLRTIYRPHPLISSFICCCRSKARLGSSTSFRNPRVRVRPLSSCFLIDDLTKMSPPSSRSNSRRTLTRAFSGNSEKSPYDTLELERGADEETIKSAYRRLAKFYHPDVYDGRGSLEEGETAEARFIKIQAAYELLMDDEKRQNYDRDHRVNPMKASQAWMEWLMKKRKAFDQRGDMAIAAWAEQQQREMNVRARRLSRSKFYWPNIQQWRTGLQVGSSNGCDGLWRQSLTVSVAWEFMASVLEAELRGMREGVRKAMCHFPSMRIWLEGDSIRVIRWLPERSSNLILPMILHIQ